MPNLNFVRTRCDRRIEMTKETRNEEVDSSVTNLEAGSNNTEPTDTKVTYTRTENEIRMDIEKSTDGDNS